MPYKNTIGPAGNSGLNGGQTHGPSNHVDLATTIRKRAQMLAHISYSRATESIKIGNKYSVYLMKDNYQRIECIGSFTPTEIIQGTGILPYHTEKEISERIRKESSGDEEKHIRIEDVIWELAKNNPAIKFKLATEINGEFNFNNTFLLGKNLGLEATRSIPIQLSKYFVPKELGKDKETEREKELQKFCISYIGEGDDDIVISFSSGDSLDLAELGTYRTPNLIACDCELLSDEGFSGTELEYLKDTDKKLRISLIEI